MISGRDARRDAREENRRAARKAVRKRDRVWCEAGGHLVDAVDESGCCVACYGATKEEVEE